MSFGCPLGSSEIRQISLLGCAEEVSAATGCPIAFEQAGQIKFLPQGRTDQREEPGEAVAPLAETSAEAQQQINQQGSPDLPTDGVGVVAEEVGQLQRLLEFLEEDFDAPAAAIEVGDGLGTPRHIVGEEHHFAEFAVHFDQGGNAAQRYRIVRLDLTGQDDEVVAQKVAARPVLKFADDAALQVVLGAGDPEHLPHRQVGEMGEVQIRLVKDHNLPGAHAGAHFARPQVVVFARRGHQCELGQEGLEIEPDMALGGSFAPAMFGPVQTAGDELNGGRVHDVNHPLEAAGKPRPVARSKSRRQGLQVRQHFPEQLFGQLRIPLPVGVRETILARRGRAPNRRERTGAQSEGVTHVIETQTVRYLRVKQTDDMTPRAERAGLSLTAGSARQLRHQMVRNEIAKLAQKRKLTGGWLVPCFIHALPCGRAKTSKPTFFIPQTWKKLWDSCDSASLHFSALSGLFSRHDGWSGFFSPRITRFCLRLALWSPRLYARFYILLLDDDVA